MALLALYSHHHLRINVHSSASGIAGDKCIEGSEDTVFYENCTVYIYHRVIYIYEGEKLFSPRLSFCEEVPDLDCSF